MCLLLFIFLKLIFSQKRKARFYLAQNIRFFIQKKRCFLKIAVPEFYNIKKRLSILAKSLKNKNEHELFHMHFQEFCLLFRNTYLREYLWVTVSVNFKGGFNANGVVLVALLLTLNIFHTFVLVFLLLTLSR